MAFPDVVFILVRASVLSSCRFEQLLNLSRLVQAVSRLGAYFAQDADFLQVFGILTHQIYKQDLPNVRLEEQRRTPVFAMQSYINNDLNSFQYFNNLVALNSTELSDNLAWVTERI